MTYEKTNVGIKYLWNFKPAGYKITIYPVKGMHSRTDIVAAKEELRQEYLTSIIEVEWITDDVNETLTVGHKAFA